MNLPSSDNPAGSDPTAGQSSDVPRPRREDVEEKALRLARGGASDDDIRVVCRLTIKQMDRLWKRIDRSRREYRMRLRCRLVQSALEGHVPALKALLADDVKFMQEDAVPPPNIPIDLG